jgi:hypothetical protein
MVVRLYIIYEYHSHLAGSSCAVLGSKKNISLDLGRLAQCEVVHVKPGRRVSVVGRENDEPYHCVRTV